MAQYFAGGTKPVFDISRKFGKKTKTKGKANTIKKGSKSNFNTVGKVTGKNQGGQNLTSNNPITENTNAENTVTAEETVTFLNVESLEKVVDVEIDGTELIQENTDTDNDAVIGLALKSVGPRNKKDEIVDFAKTLGIDLNADVLTKKEMLNIINEATTGTGDE